MKTIQLKVVFMDGEIRSFDIPEGGSWSPHIYEQGGESMLGIEEIIVRPEGKGIPRFHIPMGNIRYYQVVELVEEVTQHEEGNQDGSRLRRIPGRKLPVLKHAPRRITDSPTA